MFFLIIDCPFFARNIKVSASFDTTITSPNYPLNYANDERCRWQINTESGYVIKVTFNYFSLEPDEASSKTRCAHDSLEFHHGDGFFPNLVGKYCGKIHPEVIYSTGQEMYVQFKSDDRLTLKGFNISVSAVKAGTVLVSWSTVILTRSVAWALEEVFVLYPLELLHTVYISSFQTPFLSRLNVC